MRLHLRRYLEHLRRVPDDASDGAVQDMLDEARQLVDGSRIYVMLDLAPGAASALEGKPGRIWGDTGLIGRPPVRVAPQCEAARLLSLPIPEPAGDTDLGFLIVENRLSDRMLSSDELRCLHRLARRLGEILNARGLRPGVGAAQGAACRSALRHGLGTAPCKDGGTAGVRADEDERKRRPGSAGGGASLGAERHAQMVEKFVHDMANLVAVIDGSARMLSEELGGSAHLKRILEANRQILAIMETLRGAGRHEIRHRWVDLGRLLRAAADLVQAEWPKGIRLDLDLPGQEALALADPVQVSRIVLNLLCNARDAVARKTPGRAPEGRVRLSLRRQCYRPGAEDRAWYEFCIVDDGIGMDADTRRNMFLPHFTRKGAAGSGLGIAFLDCQIRELGGRISVETAPGRGTAICILWPEVFQ
ncbi:HAMP domain-containing histidine kinase [Rhodovulum sulfidophilum]|uniref:ATP-binding protein n=1 Tax=Rhodovulum sulfidophilum TaxID=35806 RepID=UPI0019249B6D|nr:HAMP domain-containing sensor histidine kinase [Rhodovulum sulfidophilum]MBL3596776.1 HAMP domain-containing histidine kinase [Rhodovulum sulfidophilum]